MNDKTLRLEFCERTSSVWMDERLIVTSTRFNSVMYRVKMKSTVAPERLRFHTCSTSIPRVITCS